MINGGAICGNCSQRWKLFISCVSPISCIQTIQNVTLDSKSYSTDHQVVLNCQKQISTAD